MNAEHDAQRGSAAGVERAEFRLLGPLQAIVEGRPVTLGAPKQRALLAHLLLRANEAVPVERLIDALWPEEPPESARPAIQVYVSRLRAALGGAGRLESRSRAYVLRAVPDEVDLMRFRKLVAEAHQSLDGDEADRAAEALRQALALWRGRALADLDGEPGVDQLVLELEEERLAAIELRMEAELAAGRDAELVPELEALVSEYPAREELHAHLMLALYRAGRQADALEVYRDARTTLRDELGLDPGGELRELERAILRQDEALAAPAAERAARPRLPAAMTPLVDRERSLVDLRALVLRPEVRLVTLTGAAGSGKTRLALALAESCEDDFANGSALVEAAPLADPALVIPTIARALAVPESADEPIASTLSAWLATRELLLVLDNLEHLADAGPALVALARAAPRLTLLVTSRRVLHLSGEHVFPVPPLAEDDALELFLQRARALEPAFSVTTESEAEVRDICRRVDGLPLAIELAAAWIPTIPPRALAEHLTKRLTVLTAGPRDLPARQQTLRETLDWSYDLLREEERRILSRIAVFAGTWTSDAAAAVCDAELDTLSALVDHSLVRRVETDATTRFGLLETIREYGLERLTAEGEEDAVRTRHAEWYVELAVAAEPRLVGEDQTSWFGTLEAEHDNFRAALAHLAETGQRELLLRLTVPLTRFWYVRGYLTEARRWLEQALADSGEVDPNLRRRALIAAAALALLQGDYGVATARSEESVAAARETGEPLYVANALSNLGAIVLAAGDADRAEALLEEAVPLAREAGDERIAALAINNLGDVALTRGDYERAEPLFEESLALLRARSDTANVARALFNLGAVALKLGRLDEARARFRESVAHGREAGDKEDLAWCLEGLAGLAAAAGEGERAALLLGAADALLDEMGAAFKPFERQLHDATEKQARALCGDEIFAEATRRGAGMALSEALETALAAGAGSRLAV
jgi:predicted ATPase/DNA-binding SARP family transcriptional activator